MGASFGAYHAANSRLLKAPDVFRGAFAMSSVSYDVKNFMDGMYSTTIFSSTPPVD